MQEEKNRELCRKYPFLLPRNVWTDKLPDDYDYSWTELDALPDGWRMAFGEMMMEDIAEALKKSGNLETFRFDQIKEKWGSARLYYHGGNKEVDEIIENYSCLSENICMVCGKPDVYMTVKGWIYPCCKECWEKNKHNHLPYEDSVDGEARMADTRRYRRYSPGTDGFEDVEVDISGLAERIRKEWERRCASSK